MAIYPTICHVHYDVLGNNDLFRRRSKASTSLDRCRTAFRYSTDVGDDSGQLPAMYHYDIITKSITSPGQREAMFTAGRSRNVKDNPIQTKASRLPSRLKPTSLASSTSADLRRRCTSAISSSSACVRSVPPTPAVSCSIHPRTATIDELQLGHAPSITSGQNPDWPWIVEFRCADHPYRLAAGDERTSQVRWDSLHKAWIAVSENPVACGWYLKFVKGLQVNDRNTSDLAWSYSEQSRRYNSHLSNQDEGYGSSGWMSADSRRGVMMSRGRKSRTSITTSSSIKHQQQLIRSSNQPSHSTKSNDKDQLPVSPPGVDCRPDSGAARAGSGSDLSRSASINERTNAERPDSEELFEQQPSISCEDTIDVRSANTDITTSHEDTPADSSETKAAAATLTSLGANGPQMASQITSSDDSLTFINKPAGSGIDLHNNVVKNIGESEGNLTSVRSVGIVDSTTQNECIGNIECYIRFMKYRRSSARTTLSGSGADGRIPPSQKEIIKKDRKPQTKKTTTGEPDVTRLFHGPYTHTRTLMFGNEDFSTKQDRTSSRTKESGLSDLSEDVLQDSHGDFDAESPRSRDRNLVNPMSRLPASETEQLLLRRRARRRQAQWTYDRMSKDGRLGQDVDAATGRLDEYDWLAKYCIIHPDKVAMFATAFDEMDENHQGHLDAIGTMAALKIVNPSLSDADEEYLYSILALVGYSVMSGADYRLFAVLASLSYRVTAIDNWVREILAKTDCRSLVSKVYKCKALWQCCVEPESTAITIDQLCIELRAGGVRKDHIDQVRSKLGPPRSPLDILDFISYAPLFIMIHTSVVDQPLNDKCEK